MIDESSPSRDAEIAWEGNSLDVISGFPDEVKENLGFQLRLLQRGQQPTDYRPVKEIGAGVFELRTEDQSAWYRVLYISRINDVIYVLHCFDKKSREIPRNDVRVAQQRFAAVQARIREEKKRAKR